MPSPIVVARSLSGIDYPARKNDLIQRARYNGADSEMLAALQALPDREYDDPSGVQNEL